MTSVFVADKSGNVPAGQTMSVSDSNRDGKLSVGDTVVVKNSSGAQVSTKQLTADDMYEVRFRENMTKAVNSVGRGWDFSDKLVDIQNNTLSQPFNRTYVNSYGLPAQEKVLEQNKYWEVVQRNGQNYLLMRTTDSNGNAVKASDALNDLLNNKQNYAFDCATPMPIFNMKATLDTIGADDFNAKAGRLMFSGWYDQYDNSKNDGGFVPTIRTAQAGEVSVNGVRNLAGETAMFNTALGDDLRVGSTYYFDKPGDKTSATQGWNAIYMGRDATNGNYQFWSSSAGTISINFQNGSWIPSGGYSGDYLGAAISDPNIARLKAWDTTPSV
jgi:hypothetical protein